MNNNEEYKLYNGDCLAVMDKLIEQGVKVDAIITDPPYGTTACKWDIVIPFDEMWNRLNKLIKPTGAIALFALEFKSITGKSCLHPTQKPVDLLEYLIRTYTNENDLVLDFTMGSGSTGVACINTNRKFIGVEINEKYFNIAKDRIEAATLSNKQKRLF